MSGDLSAIEIPQEMPREIPQGISESVTEDLQGEPTTVPEPHSWEKGMPKAGSLRVIDVYSWLFGDEDEENGETEDSEAPSFFGATGNLRSFDLIGWLFDNGDDETESEESGNDKSQENTVAALPDNENIQVFPPPVTAPDYEILFTPLRSPLTAEGRGEDFDLYLWFLTELPARRINAKLRELTEKQQR
ncbi:MAG: hypothetical protein QF386_01310 [Alphaproteobacteria bacterium]|nr:hypothetical protein [Alphaproteobacteria bacterium]MDP6660352.1 hypothetical protein [Alphaproteobacteria bacterium]MDP6781094.1 hypothetical protein [Alphaproteobacteria bacterium]MDP7044252.1 hypothetical protein [Alphaproteobacteria bacterium]